MSGNQSAGSPSLAPVMDIFRRCRESAVLITACEFDLFTILAEGERTAADLAERRGVSAESMEQLLSACAG